MQCPRCWDGMRGTSDGLVCPTCELDITNYELDQNDIPQFMYEPDSSLGTRESQLERNCVTYLVENPHFWTLFVRHCMKAIKAGYDNYSVRAILHVVRWHTRIELRDQTDFKINNNHSPTIARMFHQFFPERSDFFETRERISKNAPPRDREVTREEVSTR